MKWMLITGAVAAFGVWTGGVAFLSYRAGQDDCQAETLSGAVEDRDKQTVATQGAIDDLDTQGGAVTDDVGTADTAAHEASRTLARKGVMADCAPLSADDVRAVQREFDSIDAAAGVAHGRPDTEGTVPHAEAEDR